MSRKFLPKVLSRMVLGVVAAGAMVVTPSGAVAQQVCETIEADPPPDPSTFVPVPEVCFGGGAPGPTECTDDGCVIDVLVIYTPAARAAAGGTNGINNIINLAEIAHNTALSDSDVNVHIRVVMTYELDSNDLEDQSFSFVLNCLGRQVCLPEVDDLRREVKADVLSLFVDVLDMPSIHGAAKIIGTYHVIEWLAAFRQPVWGFTHELGHNIGCRHQFLQDSSLSPFAYCHAYSRSSSPFFQTVVGFSPNENTILRFSNPDLLYSGVPMGDPATANNALCIRNSAQNLASRQISDCDGDGVCDIDEDCNGNGVPDPCDLDCGPAGGLCDVPNCGLAPDCNFSCVPDSCDITAGTSADCNANGVPDECDPDCDGDGIPDDCDSSCCIDSDCQAGNVCCNFICRECCDPDNCGTGEVCCNNQCEECCDDPDCTDPFKPLCRPWDNVCVLCYDDSHCGSNCCCMANGSCFCGPFACGQYLWGP